MLCAWVVVLALAPAPIDVSDPEPRAVIPGAVGGLDGSRAEEQRRARYLRTGLETAALMALPTLAYWTHPAAQTHDWDLKFDWSSWERKLDLKAVRFDGNRFETNVLMHPIAGTAYYQAARDNGFGVFQSYLSSFLASFFWEYMVEFRELPSLNDIIVTPAAGVAVGEPSYRLSRALASGSPSVASRIGSWILSPIAGVNDLLMGRRPALESGPGEHRLWAEIGAASASVERRGRREELNLAAGGAVVAHPGYRQPGHASEGVAPGAWSALSARLRLDRASGLSGVDLHAGTLFVGRYLKDYDPGGGAGLLLGLGSSFDFDTRALGPTWDRIGSVGLLGPVIELTVDRPRFGLFLSLSGAYSFAMIQSLAYVLHGEMLSGAVIRTSLRGVGCYYGHGLTSRAQLALRLMKLEVALAGDVGLFRSIQGRDRFQERLDADFTLEDRRTSWSAQVAVPLWRGVRLAGRLEKDGRRSQLLNQTSTAAETRVLLLFAFAL
jgi:Domain of unknown function (DUF3943)